MKLQHCYKSLSKHALHFISYAFFNCCLTLWLRDFQMYLRTLVLLAFGENQYCTCHKRMNSLSYRFSRNAYIDTKAISYGVLLLPMFAVYKCNLFVVLIKIFNTQYTPDFNSLLVKFPPRAYNSVNHNLVGGPCFSKSSITQMIKKMLIFGNH